MADHGGVLPAVSVPFDHDLVVTSRFWTVTVDTLTVTDDSFRHHDDVIKWKHFPRYWPFVRGIHRSPVNSPHKGQWRGALMFSLNCVWIHGWANNREAGDLRRYRAHYDVTVMSEYYHSGSCSTWCDVVCWCDVVFVMWLGDVVWWYYVVWPSWASWPSSWASSINQYKSTKKLHFVAYTNRLLSVWNPVIVIQINSRGASQHGMEQ